MQPLVDLTRITGLRGQQGGGNGKEQHSRSCEREQRA
jgi:hypothetical protein